MENIKTYKEYLNESVRDLMKPKSEEDIKKSVAKLSPQKKLLVGIENDMLWLIKDVVENDKSILSKLLELDSSEDVYEFPLVYAISEGRTEIAKYILDSISNIPKEIIDKAIRSAALIGDYEILSRIVNKNPDTIEKAFHFIIRYMQPFPDQVYYDMIKMLLEMGADVHYRDDAALSYAINNQKDDVIKLLLDNGANLREARKRYTIAGKKYAKKFQENGDFLKKLLDFKKFNKTNESIRDLMKPKSEEDIRKTIQKLSPDNKLKVGCKEGILWAVKEALKEGADIFVDHMANHALYIVCRNKHEDIVKYILSEMDLKAENYIITYALTQTSSNSINIYKILLDAGANPDVCEGMCILHASRRGCYDLVKLLLDYGAHDNIDKAIKFAELYGYEDIVKLLKNYK